MPQLILDDREDTALYKALIGYDLDVSVARLEYGDACWEGNGPDGPALVGVERKHLADVVSSMHDRRLSGHQLKGMWQHYEYCYLLIEDYWRADNDGGIEVIRGSGWCPFRGHTQGSGYRQLQNYLNTLEVLGGVIVLRTCNIRETAAVYASLAAWWSKEWAGHHSHDEVFTRQPGVALHRGKARLSYRVPGMVEKMAAQLPGIDQRCWEVGKKFPTVERMVNATYEEWLAVPGVGKMRAKEIMQALHERGAKDDLGSRSSG